jgi:hypothetical protein
MYWNNWGEPTTKENFPIANPPQLLAFSSVLDGFNRFTAASLISKRR